MKATALLLIAMLVVLTTTPVARARVRALTFSVSVETELCTLTLLAQPPDASGGWTAQFKRDAGINIGGTVTASPFTKVLDMQIGTYVVYVTWTKRGEAQVISEKLTRECE